MKNKVVGIEHAVDFIKDGMTIMIGGFLGVGTPHAIIDAMVKKGVKNITLISNDTGITGSGNSKLIAGKLVKKAITSHIGTNPETGKQMIAGELDVQLTPQGTMAERIRAAGVGLGGVLTPTGVGTSIAEGKQVITIDDKQYLLELPLKADIALLRGSTVDTFGNTMYRGTSQNFNKVMAMAADVVIVEAGELVEIGQLDANCVMTPGIFVDYVVKGEPSG